MTIPPVQRTITVPWPQDQAFARFTAEISSWWPYKTHSIGGAKVQEIRFEAGVGGRILEQHGDGRRFQWGTVLEWDPPRRVRFTWHPGSDPDQATDVELTFTAVGGGTRLDLVHTGWERLGAKGPKQARGYNIGWRYVLDVWAGRRGPFVVALDLVGGVVGLVQRLKRGPGDPRNEAGGEIRV